ncbi:photosynthetic NDH subunit of subcomplex B 3, chloroplastic isoform X2 [Rhododendron vialii]|uniref:photosynthetic NDH subunit of subcomplex B 3, chloroplastic isoform X2 n=1 Tax=Rhododendron vialii TaxID=182163 RepID=UPI00265F6B59|nr:photosynthetic NDH subunit of subcomplex B 3, chloroplastic isoform X2 [Rhododendron vialii]
MASLHLVSLSIRLPDFSAGAKNYRNSATLASKKTPISVSFAVNSPESAPEAPEKPEIELEFIGPRPGDDGEYPMERARTVSGEKLLRNIMLDGKIELYAPYGKVMNCGGGGSCGTCIVEKPESWRLACQSIVGNKENSGKVLVQRLPQWKK